MIIIPIFKDDSPMFTQEIELNGGVYNLYIYWNARDEAWYLDVRDVETEESIVAGMKLVPVYDMNLQYRSYSTMPRGTFIVLDLEDDSVNSGITFDNLYVRYILAFITEEEIEAGEVVETV